MGWVIIKIVCGEGVDYIVMGLWGLGILCKMFMGSVSDYIVYYVYILVIVVWNWDEDNKWWILMSVYCIIYVN